MALKQRLNLRLTQRLILTPKMRQALHILQLPLLELKRFLRQEMLENPFLEEEEIIDNLLDNKQLAPDYSESDNYNTSYGQDIQKKKDYQETLATYAPSLQEHLLRQLGLSSPNPILYKTAEFIIGNIDENGYRHCSHQEIQQILGVGKSDIYKALNLIYTFDPPGAGAEDLKECLFIQLKQKNQENSLAAKIVCNYLTDLEKKKYSHLAGIFKVPLEQIEEAVRDIAALEPKPGRTFANSPNPYIKPDIILIKQKERYEIIINDEELPILQISSQYSRLLQDEKVAISTKIYLKKQFHSALWLIKTVGQRQSTLMELARFLVEAQRDFLDKGKRYLAPLSLEKIAKSIKRDKSTVSRLLANKYIQTPFGIFPLREFLSHGIKTKKGKLISTKNIKAQIEDLIKGENPEQPLTDEKIAQTLKERSIPIARRTCAKYREQLKILPATLRKNPH